MADLKTKWCAVKEDLESQLKAQKTEKKTAPTKMMPTERYLTASSNKTNANNDVNESRGMEKEIVLSENLETSSIHRVKITIPNKISENQKTGLKPTLSMSTPRSCKNAKSRLDEPRPTSEARYKNVSPNLNTEEKWTHSSQRVSRSDMPNRANHVILQVQGSGNSTQNPTTEVASSVKIKRDVWYFLF
ncbi:uncharacterized protein LOC120924459 isoform X2 [Rana temporaria]|uniref:uncharacterized protein LOC120924459 isoform X2 n=1 Tax=Rana temporaria TaxID=8407 RepID=UPI001AAC4F8A|nr:uncharacterized protein LOC120924459 isoform X2 [Rana temporaria]